MPLKVIKRHLDTEGFDPRRRSGSARCRVTAGTLAFSEREMSGSLEAAEAERTATEATVEPEPAASQAAEGRRRDRIGESDGRELAEASGTDLGFVGELEKLGLIAPVQIADRAVFDDEALLVAKAAAAMIARGWRSVTSACTRWPLIVERASSPSCGLRRWPRVARLLPLLVTTSPTW